MSMYCLLSMADVQLSKACISCRVVDLPFIKSVTYQIVEFKKISYMLPYYIFEASTCHASQPDRSVITGCCFIAFFQY